VMNRNRAVPQGEVHRGSFGLLRLIIAMNPAKNKRHINRES
jgi:hypothetical protein